MKPKRITSFLLGLTLIVHLLCSGAFGSTNLVISLHPDGTLSWDQAFTNGVLTIESTTNLSTGIWLPYLNVLTTNGSGIVLTTNESGASPVAFTNRVAFYRGLAADASMSPTGMVLVPGGYFQMGDNYNDGRADEYPVHTVYVSQFYIDKFEVTNRKVRDVYQWAYDHGLVYTPDLRLIKSNVGTNVTLFALHWDSYSTNDTRYWSGITFSNGLFSLVPGREDQPCIDISWYGAAAYCTFKSLMEGLNPCFELTNYTCDFSKNGYRLPTEAEWEKAARGGTTDNHYPWLSYGDSYNSFINSNMANYTPPTLPHPFHMKPVGYYNGEQTPPGPNMANGYGTYDMAGNAREWCFDFYGSNWYSQPGATLPNPTGPTNGDLVTFGSVTAPGRVTRGGSFDLGPFDLRVTDRIAQPPVLPTAASWYNGFRTVRRP